jgi:Ca-activated chloride channel homolog
MNRIAFAFTLLFAAANILAQNPPADPPQQPAPAAAAPAPADAKRADPNPPEMQKDAKAPDQGVRKLSRRERKERIKNLPDNYREFLRDVEPIMLPHELDTFLILETDPQRDVYINEFWRRRDVAQGTTNHAFKDEYYARLESAKERFKYMSTDRARVYLIHGEPQDIISVDCSRLLQPIQIWKYFYIPQFGHNVRFLFYIPRRQQEYRLWTPTMDQNGSLAELVAQDIEATTTGGDGGVQSVFYDSAAQGTSVSKIQAFCPNGDEILKAIFQMQQNQTDLPKVFEPPPINEEDVTKILRSIVLLDPNAPKIPAELQVTYPAKQGTRTDVQMTVLVPRAQTAVKQVGATKTYSLDVTGEVLKDNQLFENFRYRFDFPGDTKDEKLPLILERLLRPNSYTVRLKVTDMNSGAQAIVEKNIEVPEIFDTADQQKQKEASSTAVAALKDAIESSQTTLRIVPLPEDLVSGIQHIETMAVGNDVKAVEFYLDGRKVMTKRQPPYTLDIDLGDVPRPRNIRAVALGEKNQILTGDEIVVNTGTDPFRVRIVSPRIAVNIHGPTRVEMAVNVPDGKKLDNVQLFYNDTPVSTLYGPPYVQTVDIPATQGVAYIRAVASLKNDPTPPVEDLVMINTPQFMEEVNVHLVELPTTVIVNGRPDNTLQESSFRVLDEGKPVKISKFEHVKNLPLSIGMAIDTSASMTQRMSEAQKAGAQFFKNVLKSGDKAFLVSFDTQAQLIQKWSTKLSDVNAGLSKLRAEEATALYDAIVYSLYNFVGVRGQKALVVITDGRDNASKFSFDQAVEYARRAAVPIYGVGIGIGATDIDARYKLGRFCAETGGNLYMIDRAEDLHRIYGEIQDELRSQYVLGFYPADGVKPGGKWREVTVRVSEGKAKTIRGYYP